MSQRNLFIVLLLGAVLTVSAFFAGKWVQDYRRSEVDPSSPPANQTAVRPMPDPKPSGRIPGAFEHQAALLLGVNGLLEVDPEAFVQIVTAIHDRIKIIGVIANQKQEAQAAELLKSRGLRNSSVQYFEWPVESMWVRDYAPYFMVGDHTTVIDFTYARPPPRHGRLFPSGVGRELQFPLHTLWSDI